MGGVHPCPGTNLPNRVSHFQNGISSRAFAPVPATGTDLATCSVEKETDV